MDEQTNYIQRAVNFLRAMGGSVEADAVEAMRKDAERLAEMDRLRLAATPVEGGGWDVYVYDADDSKETLLGSGVSMRAAIDEAIDAATRDLPA